MNRKKWMIYAFAGLVVLGGLTVLIAVFASGRSKAQTWKEVEAVKGTLSVGVTESGNVSIGTSTQSFELDLSAYESSSSADSTAAAFPFEMQMAGAGSGQSESRLLEVEAVHVEAGEEINLDTPLVTLSASSVETIRRKLLEDAESAKLYYEQTLTAQKQTNQQAESDRSLDEAYGTNAQAEYEKTVYELNQAVEEAAKSLETAKESAAEMTAEIEEKEVLLATQKEVLVNAEYAKDNTSKEEALYWWVVAVNTADEAQELVDTLEEELETAKEELEKQNSEIASCNQQLALANRSLAAGIIEAKSTLSKRQLHFENAQEIYDVTVESGEFVMECAKEDYEVADERLAYFDNLIRDNMIYSAYAGVITDVGVSKGDGLLEGSTIITLNDYQEATITLDVEEEDILSAQPGNAVNVILTAYPENVLAGEVLEVGDAQINSNTNKTTYSVTVQITQEMTGLYEGMSAEVTFITKETEEVLYIPNRAVTREGTISTVKKKTAEGKTETTTVITGFSDGVNVEIKEGLSEGDTVVIESNVG